MKFISLNISIGLLNLGLFDFSKGINLIYSKKNSVGKTSLLRLLLFSLGYPIPNIRGFNFYNYDLGLKILNDSNEILIVKRRKDYVTLTKDDVTDSFSLPNDIYSLHEKIFKNSNVEVLDNLLGAYYLDQEKGWTLLNRGTVIGKIYFNIESLVRGLSDRSDKKLIDEYKMKERELEKYKYMFDMAKYQSQVKKLGENIAYDTPIEEIDKELRILINEREPIKNELERIKDMIKENMKFINYISLHNIVVVNDDGVETPVNESTIKYYKEDKNFEIAKRKIYEKRLTNIDKKIFNLQNAQRKEGMLINLQSASQAFDEKVMNIPLDQIALDKTIKQIQKEISEIKEMLRTKTKIENPIVAELFASISEYAQKLNVDDKYIRPYQDYIFTRDLKTLSGAIYHKVVFCFKMSYIKIISKYKGISLPIILDSPSGREVDKKNIKEMIDILNKDFTNHQIIIASIHTYDFKGVNVIELTEQLLRPMETVDVEAWDKNE